MTQGSYGAPSLGTSVEPVDSFYGNVISHAEQAQLLAKDWENPVNPMVNLKEFLTVEGVFDFVTARAVALLAWGCLYRGFLFGEVSRETFGVIAEQLRRPRELIRLPDLLEPPDLARLDAEGRALADRASRLQEQILR